VGQTKFSLFGYVESESPVNISANTCHLWMSTEGKGNHFLTLLYFIFF